MYKLFVWTDFASDYSGGLAFAIAKSEDEARNAIIRTRGYNPSNWGQLHIHSLDRQSVVAYSVSGGA